VHDDSQSQVVAPKMDSKPSNDSTTTTITTLSSTSTQQHSNSSSSSDHSQTSSSASSSTSDHVSSTHNPPQSDPTQRHPENSKMNVLASRYVPQNLLQINARRVSRIIQSRPGSQQNSIDTEAETRRVFFGLAADHFPGPYCQCTVPTPGICHNAPAPTKVVEEQKHARLSASERGSPTIPAGYISSGCDNYVNTFRECLQVEYEETLRLYERYNQYEVAVVLLRGTKNVARIDIPGIADARPALVPGDVVILRPHDAVVIEPPPQPYHYTPQGVVPGIPPYPPVAYNNAGYKRALIQTVNKEFVEIHSRIASVTRGKGHRSDSLIITFVEDDPGLAVRLAQSLHTVRFLPSTTAHERSLTALWWLRKSTRLVSPTAARDLLFPSKIPDLPPTGPIHETENDDNYVEESEYEQLNRNQARFVQMVSTRTDNPTTDSVRPPLLLTGPAGTGKSKTLLCALLQTLNRNRTINNATSQGEESNGDSNANKILKRRVLVCTPSHTACDVLTRRLADLLSRQGATKEEMKSTLFRLYDMDRPVEMTPVELLPYTRQKDDGNFCLPSTHELLNFSVIICTCQDAHLLYLAGCTNSSLRQRRQCLQDKIEKGLRAAGLQLPKEGITGACQPHFTHLFIDEAAQATEPESLIPISVVMDFHPTAFKAEIALCGDPRQLSPGIFSPLAQECLQRSLLERLLRLSSSTYGGGRDHLLGPPSADSWNTMEELIEYSFQKKDCQEHLSVFLNLSYRGHPSFLLMPSKLFYFDKLKSALRHQPMLSGFTQDEDKWTKATLDLKASTISAYPENLSGRLNHWPIHFRGVLGHDKSAVVDTIFGSNSWCNEEEAQEVLAIVETITKSGIGTDSIGVMALFRAQVVLIRKLLRDRGLGAVNVGTVENYQAVESNVVILSLTRSNKEFMREDVARQAGIFFQPKRMNVALTRAEHMLVVVGNPNMMVEDPAWAAWLEFTRENGLWFGEKLDGER
jgi:AAA domain